MSSDNFPPGWDQERVRRVLEHYESQSDEEAVAEDEAPFEETTHTTMKVPVDLVPTVCGAHRFAHASRGPLHARRARMRDYDRVRDHIRKAMT
jgi:hypothetical protein